MTRTVDLRSRLVAAFLAAASLMVVPAVNAAEPPTGRYYGVVVVARNPATGMIETEYECLNFTKAKVCAGPGPEGPCGTWEITGSTGSQNTWSGEIVMDYDGVEALLVFSGQTERAGKGSSIAATVYVSALDAGGGLSGTQMSRQACREFAASDEPRSQ